MSVLENQLFYAGADGCRAGWLVIALTRNRQWQTEVFSDIAELWEKYQKTSLTLLDIHIGLKEKGAEGFNERLKVLRSHDSHIDVISFGRFE
jgi:predicted RNase H-like nuclease